MPRGAARLVARHAPPHEPRAPVVAVVHAMMSLSQWVFAFWKEMVAEARVERRYLRCRSAGRARHRRRVGHGSPLAERAQYLRRAAAIAASSEIGLARMTWGAWHSHTSSAVALRTHLLAEHTRERRRKWLARLHQACAVSRQQKLALRAPPLGRVARRCSTTRRAGARASKRATGCATRLPPASALHLLRRRAAHVARVRRAARARRRCCSRRRRCTPARARGAAGWTRRRAAFERGGCAPPSTGSRTRRSCAATRRGATSPTRWRAGATSCATRS